MPEAKIIDTFSAAHHLRHYHGQCESLHGHNWQVEITVQRERLDKNGMVMDFVKLKKLTRRVLSILDHSYLNKLTYFRKHNPTSENMAGFISAEINKKLKPPLTLKEVRVWETERNCAIWP